MKTLIILSFVLGGCFQDLPDPYWHDGQKIAATIETSIPDASARAYKDRVRLDVELWNHGLKMLGCPTPFAFTDHPDRDTGLIILSAREIAAGEWFGATYEQPSVIYIRPQGDGTLDAYVGQPTWNVVQHELGHALGLPHNQRPDSIMCDNGLDCFDYKANAKATEPFIPAIDLRDAAEALGCP